MPRLYRERPVSNIPESKEWLSQDSFKVFNALERAGSALATAIENGQEERSIRYRTKLFKQALNELRNHLAKLERGKDENNSSDNTDNRCDPDGPARDSGGSEGYADGGALLKKGRGS